MKKIVLRTLVIIVVCILTTGCTTPSPPHKDESGNVTFAPFSVPPPNVTRGPLKISNGGWTGEYPVTVDNRSVGVVSTKNPLTLMIEEGSHVVEVCCGTICEHENVHISYRNKLQRHGSLLRSSALMGFLLIQRRHPCYLPVSYTHLRAHETDSYLV